MKDLTAQTGVSREATHFYLREGLLPEPTRPKPNVAHYTAEHVVRINTIKQLQQQRSLSLDTIKTMLQEFDCDALSASDDLAMLTAVYPRAIKISTQLQLRRGFVCNLFNNCMI